MLAIAMLAPAGAAAADYNSDQKPVRSYSLSCGHLGKECKTSHKARKAAKKGKRTSKRNKKVRKSCKGRSSVRAFAAVPRSNRHVAAARCRR